MKKILFSIFLCVALLVGGCGTSGGGKSSSQDQWQTIKEIDGREILAELDQTVDESPIRDRAAQQQLETPDYTEGHLGEPSKELEEDVAVQAIEGPIAIKTVEDVYGGNEAFDREGVLFLENQTYDANQSGVWIGVKHPDERLQKVIDSLQAKVDAGEILAEPIFFFRSPHTQHELYAVQDEVATVLKNMQQKRGSYSLAVNTITGVVEIGHDFLSESQQKELEKQFPDFTFDFEQEGNMVASPGMSAIIHPDEEKTETPVKEGGFIMDVSDGTIFVAGGTEGAVYYSFGEAHLLKVGQRVHVEASGAILESYPGQGAAKFVEILPDYQPATAVLSESEAIAKAIEEKTLEYFTFNEIKDIRFDADQKTWVIRVEDGNEELIIEDQ